MKKLEIIKDKKIKSIDKLKRVYHEFEGTYNGYYFFASTDNSHKVGYVSYGIKNGSVYKLDVWFGGHPVGRDCATDGGHISNDFICGYHNKWDYRIKNRKHMKNVYEIVKLLELISD